MSFLLLSLQKKEHNARFNFLQTPELFYILISIFSRRMPTRGLIISSLNLNSEGEANDESCFAFLDSHKPVGDPVLPVHLCKISEICKGLAIFRNQVINL